MINMIFYDKKQKLFLFKFNQINLLAFQLLPAPLLKERGADGFHINRQHIQSDRDAKNANVISLYYFL